MRIAAILLLALLALPAQAQQQPDPKIVQEIYDCLAVGLPKNWKKAWVTITQVAQEGKERQFEGKFAYATTMKDNKGVPLLTCSAQQVARSVMSLSVELPAEQRNWKEARLLYTAEGKFTLAYDYGK